MSLPRLELPGTVMQIDETPSLNIYRVINIDAKFPSKNMEKIAIRIVYVFIRIMKLPLVKNI